MAAILTVDVQTAGGLNTAESVGHLTSVSARVIRLRVLDRQCRLVVPEEQLVLAAWVDFTRVLEPAERSQMGECPTLILITTYSHRPTRLVSTRSSCVEFAF